LAQVLALQPHLFLRASSERIVTELHMLQGFATVQAIAYHFVKTVLGIATVLPAVMAPSFIFYMIQLQLCSQLINIFCLFIHI
jgi:hypothetical protein